MEVIVAITILVAFILAFFIVLYSKLGPGAVLVALGLVTLATAIIWAVVVLLRVWVSCG